MRILKSGNRISAYNSGFSMVEVIVVIAIISILTVSAAPKLSIFFSGKRKNVSLLQNYIAKTFDDAFLNYRNNYLVVHLGESGNTETDNDLFSGENGLSVLNIEDGNFVPARQKLLQPVKFNRNFVLESVLLDENTEITGGYVIIPFFKEGYSKNRVIYVRYNDDKYITVFISKFENFPYIFEGKLGYESMWNASK